MRSYGAQWEFWLFQRICFERSTITFYKQCRKILNEHQRIWTIWRIGSLLYFTCKNIDLCDDFILIQHGYPTHTIWQFHVTKRTVRVWYIFCTSGIFQSCYCLFSTIHSALRYFIDIIGFHEKSCNIAVYRLICSLSSRIVAESGQMKDTCLSLSVIVSN